MHYFIRDLNAGYHQYPEDTIDREAWHQYANAASDIVYNSFVRQFISKPKPKGVSVSCMGYHSLEIAARHFYPEWKNEEVASEKSKLTLSLGDFFEAYTHFTLNRLGYKIESYNEAIEWNGIKGHYDFIVTDPHGNTFVLDTKTSNNRYFSSVNHSTDGLSKEAVKELGHRTFDDERAYVTQVSIYAEATGYPPCLLMVNKDSSEPVLGFPSKSFQEVTLERAKYVLDCIRKCENFGDAFQFFVPPSPREIRAKDASGKYVSTGNWAVPFEFMYSPYKHLIYEIDDEGYVVDYKYPDKYMHLKP